jgi:hypothetical protein
MKSTRFLAVMPCGLIELHRHFGETYCARLQNRGNSQAIKPGFLSESGSSIFLRNVGELLPDHKAYTFQKTVVLKPYSVGTQGTTIVMPKKNMANFQNLVVLKVATKTKAKGMELRKRRPFSARISLPV